MAVGGFGPDERLGLGVVHEAVDGGLKREIEVKTPRLTRCG